MAESRMRNEKYAINGRIAEIFIGTVRSLRTWLLGRYIPRSTECSQLWNGNVWSFLTKIMTLRHGYFVELFSSLCKNCPRTRRRDFTFWATHARCDKHDCLTIITIKSRMQVLIRRTRNYRFVTCK